MRLPFTDKFLIQLYDSVIEPLDETFMLFPKTLIEASNPELYAIRKRYRLQRRKRDFRQMVYYLKKKGYIASAPEGAILITRKGVEKVLKVKLREQAGKKRKDGKWIMVIFDIPEDERDSRDIFRNYLKVMDYQELQKSVWICPHDVFKETEALINEYDLEKYTRVFLLDEILR